MLNMGKGPCIPLECDTREERDVEIRKLWGKLIGDTDINWAR